jgi:hypothetical protein
MGSNREVTLNKPVLGLVLGGVLGIFDGLTAWFTPEVRSMMTTIVIGSTVKGLIAGLLIGLIARKMLPVGTMIVWGVVIAGLLAYGVAAMPDATGKHYYLEIILPGAIVGAIVGFATAKYGRVPRLAKATG